VRAQFGVTGRVETAEVATDTRVRGFLHIAARRESYAVAIARRVAKVLVREAGA
jgi:hypothetical protein